MSKTQKSNREIRKPKADKKLKAAAQITPFASATSKQSSGQKKR